jgi:hypothetical protein
MEMMNFYLLHLVDRPHRRCLRYLNSLKKEFSVDDIMECLDTESPTIWKDCHFKFVMVGEAVVSKSGRENANKIRLSLISASYRGK